MSDLGRLSEAADYAERGYAKAQTAGQQKALIQALLLRSKIYREQGDLSRAAAMLAEVEPKLERSLPAGHVAFASLMAERALIAQSRGDLETAMDLINQALLLTEAVVKTGGQGADFVPTLLVRRSAIELQLHRTEGATADAARGVSILQQAAQPGALSSTLGRACLALGRALQAQGKREEARAVLRSAAEHLQSALGPDHPDTSSARQLVNDLESRR